MKKSSSKKTMFLVLNSLMDIEIFFLQTGMYYEKYTKITNLNLQKIKTARSDSSIWADSIIIKNSKPLHPILEF